MAVIGRAFSAIPLYGMEHHQTSQPFLQRTNTPGSVDASFLGTSVDVNPCQIGQNGSLFLGGAAQSPAGIPALSQLTCSLQPGRPRKHKLQEANDECPLKKLRVSESSTPLVFQGSQAPGIFSGGLGQQFWASGHPQVKEAAIVPTVADQSASLMRSVSTEDMEEVAVESQFDAALRRIRDIESRLIVEDEEEDEDNSRDNHLPTLVMSDVLVEGFKQGLNESLTQKIVDSINRPSMELVLWKPQPVLLVNKLQSIASSYKTDKEETEKIRRTPAVPLLQEVNLSDVDQPCTSNVDCHENMMWNREDEEMEL
ncbi:coiled-coil domain-containing protein 117 [Hyla sarda]|uniref:coiled-coil domain-containing protein 117 n=1 Tax=Hyla sarda TaxID=327740 RepID=UPI0024C33248|nr:coiled-coil domain-containing protein 117 [Hyla sarda]XP_056393209.1 coiled-coil domain-containing protein 117 [Hyla sarda]XP_056393210.1 coiled-coil domain-containing protein 117 [Hyla sarda]